MSSHSKGPRWASADTTGSVGLEWIFRVVKWPHLHAPSLVNVHKPKNQHLGQTRRGLIARVLVLWSPRSLIRSTMQVWMVPYSKFFKDSTAIPTKSKFIKHGPQGSMRFIKNEVTFGVPGLLSQLSTWLVVLAQVMVSGCKIKPHVGLHTVHEVCLRFSLPPSFSLCPSLPNK